MLFKKISSVKIGTVHQTKRVIYRVYFACVDPLAYLVCYIVPYDKYAEVVCSKEINNLSNTSSIDFSTAKKISYGENFQGLVANSSIAGAGAFMEVTLPIEKEYIGINDSRDVPYQSIRTHLQEEIAYLNEAGLYRLANLLIIEAESKLEIAKNIPVFMDLPRYIMSFFNQALTFQTTIDEYFPYSGEKNTILLKKIFKRIIALSPKDISVGKSFANMVMLVKKVKESHISLDEIPYQVLFNLCSEWLEFQSETTIARLITTANKSTKRVVIELGADTVLTQQKVYSMIAAPQRFVYLTKIIIEDEDIGESKEISFPPTMSNVFEIDVDRCLNTHGISNEGKSIFLQSSYGEQCDYFSGAWIMEEKNRFGIWKDTSEISDTKGDIIWGWGEDRVSIVQDGALNLTKRITITFIGV